MTGYSRDMISFRPDDFHFGPKDNDSRERPVFIHGLDGQIVWFRFDPDLQAYAFSIDETDVGKHFASFRFHPMETYEEVLETVANVLNSDFGFFKNRFDAEANNISDDDEEINKEIYSLYAPLIASARDQIGCLIQSDFDYRLIWLIVLGTMQSDRSSNFDDLVVLKDLYHDPDFSQAVNDEIDKFYLRPSRRDRKPVTSPEACYALLVSAIAAAMDKGFGASDGLRLSEEVGKEVGILMAEGDFNQGDVWTMSNVIKKYFDTMVLMRFAFEVERKDFDTPYEFEDADVPGEIRVDHPGLSIDANLDLGKMNSLSKMIGLPYLPS